MIDQHLVAILHARIDTTPPAETDNTGLIQVYRKSDGILIDSRYFNSIGSAKLMVRRMYYGIRFQWAIEKFNTNWWDLSANQRREFEKIEDELYQYAYTFFEFRKVQ